MGCFLRSIGFANMFLQTACFSAYLSSLSQALEMLLELGLLRMLGAAVLETKLLGRGAWFDEASVVVCGTDRA